jgi:hypothetical protein
MLEPDVPDGRLVYAEDRRELAIPQPGALQRA